MADRTPPRPNWLQPSPEQQGLKRYLDTLRERAWIVGACFLLGIGIAIVLVLSANKVYEARADMLITPVPASNETLVSLGLLRESNDPAREVDTATQLVTTTAVADRVADQLGLDRSASSLLDDVDAAPVAQSNIVAITARAGSPDEARDLANGFADAAVAERSELLHGKIEDLLPRLRSQLEDLPSSALTAQELATEIAQLEALLAGPDPTIAVETPAVTPTDAVWPKPALTIIAGALLGIVVGVALAFALRLLDPRLRREEQLGQLFRLPVLARVPAEPTAGATPLRREELSAAAIEAYRTLRARLVSGTRTDEPRSIMITGPSASGAKTTTAINLATALATAGNRVILIEGDVRRPSIGRALDLDTESGLVSVLFDDVPLADALVTTGEQVGDLRVLLADVTGPDIAEFISLPVMRDLIEDAKRIADYVVVDSPPMTEVVDALPLAVHVDDVVLVVRLGKSLLRQTKELGELLAGIGVTPAGVVIVGVQRRGDQYYYYTRGEYKRAPRSPRSLRRGGDAQEAIGARGSGRAS